MIRSVQAVWVTVEDFERSLAFYRQLFDVEPTAILRGKGQPDRTACFELGDGTRVVLWHDAVLGSILQEIQNPVRVEVDLEVDDLDALYERLVRSGIQPLTEPAEHELGGKTFDLRDPDGNRVRVGQRWPTPMTHR